MTSGVAARVAAERAAREGYGRLVAYLAARCGDVHAAEDALADAFASALVRWPQAGVPREPQAWLLVAARNRLFDRARRDERTSAVIERLRGAANDASGAFAAGGELEDDRLAMLFACAHPALDASVRGPLMLQSVLGFDAARIASAFLVSPSAMSQRLVRAKRKIASARIPLRVPEPEERGERLAAVLDAVYATFGAGWDDPAALDSRSRDLAVEALWLGETVVRLMPDEPEALGLLALMTYAHARLAARRDATGACVPLDEQDVARWDLVAIERAETLLARAARANRIGRFQLEAAIQSAHVSRRLAKLRPDYHAIVKLYDALFVITGSPIVALNRAVALAKIEGAAAGSRALEVLGATDDRLRDYQPFWAARAELDAEAGELESAHRAYGRAIALSSDPSVRAYLESRRARLGCERANAGR